MTKTWKKIVASLLAAMLLTASFAACGGDDPVQAENGSSGENTSNAGAEAGDTAQDDGELVHMVVWSNGDANTEDCEEVSAAITEITSEKIGVEVEVMRGLDAEKMNLALTSGEQVDLMNFSSYTGGIFALVSAGMATPLDDLVEEYGQETLALIPAEDLECGKIDGVLYSIPSLKDTARAAGFAMRMDILDELGIDPATIETYDDVHDVLVKVHEAYPDMYPLVPSWGGGGMQEIIPFDNLGDKLGVLEDCNSDSTTVVNLYETDSYRELCERMYQWNQEGLIMPDATTTTENNLLSTVGFCDYENIKPGKALEMQKSYGKEFALIQITDPYKYTEITGGSSFFIPSSSERPDKAMQLWNLMFTDPEISNLFVNGLEGKHWVYTDDTHTFITTPEGMDSTASGYSCVDWSWPNPRITPVWEGGDADLWDQYQTFTEGAVASPALGFQWDSTPVMNQVTACNNVVSKYDTALRWGVLDPAESLPEFIEALKSAGIDDIVAEKQAQLDQWLENRQ